MNRPLRLATAALTASAALLLTSCGSDDKSSGADEKIAGAEQGDAKKSSPPSEPTETAAERPKISLPSDLRYEFEWAKTGDKNKDAVLADTEQYVKAVDMAIAEQDPLHKAYRFYAEGDAAAGSQKFVEEYVEYKDRITGVKRFYNARVDVTGGKTAGLVYCEDQRKAHNKSLKTGKTAEAPAPSEDDFVLYSSRLHRNDQGVWITETTTSDRGNATCQP
ncbi:MULTISPECIES: hypothetical protein [unclassified Streptomyces]|uniref:hypothetical protein n=1 Tax=unclassified Streptomyces TaxID=2593676 RepID=UPI001CBB527E|nr:MULTISPECIES: hypothetical protein [unclassified Streptomyces]WPO71280.1 hypothetical protein R9806_11915 [Streptomyces sp. KN37]